MKMYNIVDRRELDRINKIDAFEFEFDLNVNNHEINFFKEKHTHRIVVMMDGSVIKTQRSLFELRKKFWENEFDNYIERTGDFDGGVILYAGWKEFHPNS